MLDSSTIAEFIPVLVATSRDAGEAILHVYASDDFEVEDKGDGSPVTKADKAAEAIILPVLHKLAPEIAIISEENATSHNMIAPKCFFLVDPLDGTKEFMARDGKGSFTVNIALIENGEPILGIVYAPALDRLFIGQKGKGAYEINKGIKRDISIRHIPETGAVAVASKSHRDAQTNQWLEDHNISQTVSIGSSLKFCLLAAGEADVYPRFGPTMEWDTAAGDAILRAAGGNVVTPDNAVFVYGKENYRNGYFIGLGNFML